MKKIVIFNKGAFTNIDTIYSYNTKETNEVVFYNNKAVVIDRERFKAYSYDLMYTGESGLYDLKNKKEIKGAFSVSGLESMDYDNELKVRTIGVNENLSLVNMNNHEKTMEYVGRSLNEKVIQITAELNNYDDMKRLLDLIKHINYISNKDIRPESFRPEYYICEIEDESININSSFITVSGSYVDVSREESKIVLELQETIDSRSIYKNNFDLNDDNIINRNFPSMPGAIVDSTNRINKKIKIGPNLYGDYNGVSKYQRDFIISNREKITINKLPPRWSDDPMDEKVNITAITQSTGDKRIMFDVDSFNETDIKGVTGHETNISVDSSQGDVSAYVEPKNNFKDDSLWHSIKYISTGEENPLELSSRKISTYSKVYKKYPEKDHVFTNTNKYYLPVKNLRTFEAFDLIGLIANNEKMLSTEGEKIRYVLPVINSDDKVGVNYDWSYDTIKIDIQDSSFPIKDLKSRDISFILDIIDKDSQIVNDLSVELRFMFEDRKSGERRGFEVNRSIEMDELKNMETDKDGFFNASLIIDLNGPIEETLKLLNYDEDIVISSMSIKIVGAINNIYSRRNKVSFARRNRGEDKFSYMKGLFYMNIDGAGSIEEFIDDNSIFVSIPQTVAKRDKIKNNDWVVYKGIDSYNEDIFVSILDYHENDIREDFGGEDE